MGILSWLGFDGACEQEPVEITDENFLEEIRRSDVPVMLDIWSAYCQPCMALVPTVKRLACKYDGKIKVAQMNVGSAPKSIRKLGVKSTPTILFIKNGAVVEKVVGTRGQHYYEEIIDEDLLEIPRQEAV